MAPMSIPNEFHRRNAQVSCSNSRLFSGTAGRKEHGGEPCAGGCAQLRLGKAAPPRRGSWDIRGGAAPAASGGRAGDVLACQPIRGQACPESPTNIPTLRHTHATTNTRTCVNSKTFRFGHSTSSWACSRFPATSGVSRSASPLPISRARKKK